jgi:D-serine deaminase-like pyridoxal phosphate-dependent protein
MKLPPEDDLAKALPKSLAALIGQSVAAIDTPALVIDLDAMQRNLHAMQAFATQHGMRLRPHAKMHKSAALALAQMQAGAVGVCVQKPSEAAALVAGGVTDVYVSNEVIALQKCELLALLNKGLAAQNGRISVAVDSLLGIQRLAQAMATHGGDSCMDIYVEIDVGQARCGVPPGEAALPLVQAIAQHTNATGSLRFAGLQAYHGRAQHLRRRYYRQPGSACRWSPAQAAAPSRTRPPAVCLASCKRARTCLWTQTTPPTRATQPSRVLNMRCLSSRR